MNKTTRENLQVLDKLVIIDIFVEIERKKLEEYQSWGFSGRKWNEREIMMKILALHGFVLRSQSVKLIEFKNPNLHSFILVLIALSLSLSVFLLPRFYFPVSFSVLAWFLRLSWHNF